MKFLIFAPYWGLPSHVGVYRIDRFLRWLQARNIPVVLVREGGPDRVEEAPWGQTITLRAPFRRYSGSVSDGPGPTATPTRHPLMLWIAKRILCPDLLALWSLRASCHELVRQHSNGVTHVMASSPPEAPHLAAARAARQLDANLVVDMRDGWLDEPLRPELRRSRFRQWREGRHERNVLHQAAHIFVSSEVWKELLLSRHAIDPGKVTVLTNAYPSREPIPAQRQYVRTASHGSRLRLLHTGRFTASRGSQQPRCLLEPLLSALPAHPAKGDILLVGDLQPIDIVQIETFVRQFESTGWTLGTRPPVSRDKALSMLVDADGLLLLSASHGAIPSKLFEYLATRKPVLAATPANSAVSRIGADLPHVYLVDYERPADADAASVSGFLEACASGTIGPRPPDFEESTLSGIFCNALDID